MLMLEAGDGLGQARCERDLEFLDLTLNDGDTFAYVPVAPVQSQINRKSTRVTDVRSLESRTGIAKRVQQNRP